MRTALYIITPALLLALFQLVLSKPQWHTATDGTVYLIDDEQKYNWLQAYDECARRGLQLPIFETEAQIKRLDTLLRKIYATSPELYLGMHDEFNKSKDKTRPFYSISTGEKLKVTNWHPAQPDNRDTIEHCVHINRETGFKWNDVDCEFKHGYICEENHFTTKYRQHMEGKRRETNQKNTAISKEFSATQAEIKTIMENTKTETNSIVNELKESTDEIIANVKLAIIEIIMKKPYMEAVIADLSDSITAIVLENEKEFVKVSDEAQKRIDTAHVNAERSTSEATFTFSGKLTKNTKEIDALLVF